MAPERRLTHLDGLRGIAILMVVLYHAYSRHPEEPKLYTSWFAQGHDGVQLFFLLSGFLIFLSLETSSSWIGFIHRRWLRLFPAMAAVSALVLVSCPFLYERPDGLPGYYDILPGLFFIEPAVLREWLGLHVTGPLEGDFWTLFTEVKFYLIFSVAFRFWGRRAIYPLCALALVCASVAILPALGLAVTAPAWRAILSLSMAINGTCYGWFAAGALLYVYYRSSRRGWLLASGFLWVIALGTSMVPPHLGDLIVLSAIYAAFVTSFHWGRFARLLSRREWVFLGFISYPLYLVHENTGWSLILKLHRSYPNFPAWLVPIGPLLLVGSVAWLIARFIEPMVRDALTDHRPPRTFAETGGSLVRGNGAAWLALAALGGTAIAASDLPTVGAARAQIESNILASERSALQPMERALLEARRALADARASRIQTEAYLASMRAPAP